MGIKMRFWWDNGGKKDTVYTVSVVTLLLMLLKISFAGGDYKRQAVVLKHQIEKNTANIACIEKDLSQLHSDLKEIKNDVSWIKSYMKGEIKK